MAVNILVGDCRTILQTLPEKSVQCVVTSPPYFGGAGTTALVADRLERNAVMIELNPAYAEMARARIVADQGPLEAALRPTELAAPSQTATATSLAFDQCPERV